MEYCAYTESVDRFFETTGTEEGIYFRIFPLQRGSNRGVMQDHDPALGLQLDQCLLKANGVADLFLHKLFYQRLAPCVQHPPTESAAEPADSRKSNARDFDGFTV